MGKIMNHLISELLTGVAMGIGMFYILTQFGLAEAIKWRKYIDLGLFLLLMWMFLKVGSGYMASITTWAGLTISLALRMTGIFIKH